MSARLKDTLRVIRVMGMTLNCIRCWGSRSGVLGNIQYPFVTINQASSKLDQLESSYGLNTDVTKSFLFGRIGSKIIVIYWPSPDPSIKRCTCVNKRKNSRSRWMLENNITRCPGESVGDRMPKWEQAADRGFWALSQDEEEVLLWSREELGSM